MQMRDSASAQRNRWTGTEATERELRESLVGDQASNRSRLRGRQEKMAGVAGLEPVTSAVTGQRSNQLSYTPAKGHAK